GVIPAGGTHRHPEQLLLRDAVLHLAEERLTRVQHAPTPLDNLELPIDRARRDGRHHAVAEDVLDEGLLDRLEGASIPERVILAVGRVAANDDELVRVAPEDTRAWRVHGLLMLAVAGHSGSPSSRSQ